MNSNIPTPAIQVLPWNGHKSALSLTFDDGVPVHLDLVIPELNDRGLKGTFYVVAGRLTDPVRWQEASSSGHEIGNHSMDHKRVKDLGPGEEKVQVADAKNKLEEILRVPIRTFAYPFTETSPALRSEAETHHLLSRGGSKGDFYMVPDSQPDWADIPSQVALSDMGSDTYKGWIAEAQRRGAWTVFQLHGIEGAPLGWQPMPKDIFLRLLDEVKEKSDEIWVAPFAEIGAYWRAQKIVDASFSRTTLSGDPYIWEKPRLFPNDIRLKCRVSAPGIQASQKGRLLAPLADGTLLMDFTFGELTLTA